MRITISPELEAFVREKVEVGRYRTANEAINDGLRLLKDRDQAELEALRRVLRGRLTEAKRGRSLPFDERLRAGIRRRGLKRLAVLNRQG